MSDASPPHRSSTLVKAVPWILAVLAVIAVGWWLSRDGDRGPESVGERVPGPATAPDGVDEAQPEAAGETPAQARWRKATGQAPAWPEPFVPDDCSVAVRDLRALCAIVDSRDYFRDRRVTGGACGLLAGVARDLEASPPPLHGELDDVIDARRSAAHLFRTLGERRMLTLTELIALEPDLAEPMAMALYRWTAAPGPCDPPSIGPAASYDYAAWLLRTLGGQAYLRRRAPRLEALTTYYALRVLDGSVERGYDPAGVDLRTDIARALDMLSGRDDLVFGDRYVDDLRAMQDRWSRRTGGGAR